MHTRTAPPPNAGTAAPGGSATVTPASPTVTSARRRSMEAAGQGGGGGGGFVVNVLSSPALAAPPFVSPLSPLSLTWRPAQRRHRHRGRVLLPGGQLVLEAGEGDANEVKEIEEQGRKRKY